MSFEDLSTDELFVEPVHIRDNWYYLYSTFPEIGIDDSDPLYYVRVYVVGNGEEFTGPVQNVRDSEDSTHLSHFQGHVNTLDTVHDYTDTLSSELEYAVGELERSQEVEDDLPELAISTAVDLVRTHFEQETRRRE